MSGEPYSKLEVDLVDGELPEHLRSECNLQAAADFVRQYFGIDNWSGNVQITLTQAETQEGANKVVEEGK